MEWAVRIAMTIYAGRTDAAVGPVHAARIAFQAGVRQTLRCVWSGDQTRCPIPGSTAG